MRLFLLRHAVAKDAEADDIRPLNDFGESQVKELCATINRNEFSYVAQIWHSPYLRAKQTAELFKQNLSLSANCVVAKNMRPIDSAFEMADSIASICVFGGDLLVVGHNPHLEKLSGILLGGKPRIHFSNCALACFELEEMPSAANKYGSWSLGFFISPSNLRAKSFTNCASKNL